MLVFAVETSCDETSVCIMDNDKNIFSHIIFSQESKLDLKSLDAKTIINYIIENIRRDQYFKY